MPRAPMARLIPVSASVNIGHNILFLQISVHPVLPGGAGSDRQRRGGTFRIRRLRPLCGWRGVFPFIPSEVLDRIPQDPVARV